TASVIRSPASCSPAEPGCCARRREDSGPAYTHKTASEAEGGLQTLEKKKEEEEEEKEVAESACLWEQEQEEATVEACFGDNAPNFPGTGTLLSLRTKAQDKGPVENKLELHPLQNRWVLWFFKNDRSRAWQDNLHMVTKVDTVEDFWA
ncbi:hypothetical protein H1C71_002169, partial [Ictidomys tridecemlineatus]